ncbi:hypothetical protein [Roseibium sp. RKSG952]|uniref:hypothetical protein n=1 Tax=Roseibium sp. RKSG952 TaxID=2529384 RepID=UPI0012BD540C|nr:hypothetical protein [Roseibium sp. RKSG952]MTH96488.1 hypothetical protein [Roseibium sp. RKSG952]
MRFLIAAISALAATTVASAETVRREVPANKVSVLGANSTFNKSTCLPGEIPQYKVTKAPKHGEVSFRTVSYKLSESAGRCAGKPVKATAVVYKPKRGYKGEDTFKVGFTMQRYSNAAGIRWVQDTYKITVK